MNKEALNQFEQLAVEVLKKNAAGLKYDEQTSQFHFKLASKETTPNELYQSMRIMAERVNSDTLHIRNGNGQNTSPTSKSDYVEYRGPYIEVYGNRLAEQLANFGVNYPGSSAYLSKTV